jgi:hypothetical protein
MKSVFSLYVRGNQQIARVRDWLYADNGPALQRKQEKFSQVLAER